MDPFIGEIRLFPWDWAPKGWALCSGQLLGIAQNQALFSLLGTYYGGNGSQNFALPNLNGRTPLGAVNGAVGSFAGQENVALTLASMPAHTHALIGSSVTATARQPLNNAFGSDNSDADFYGQPTNLVTLLPGSIGQAGSGTGHPNMQPYLVMNYCIALQGVFPTRN